VLNVSEAALPNEPGVYRRLACEYQELPASSEQTQTKSLGKTGLEDLEKLMGRKLSTPELLTHPLWRREHTHTTYAIERSQFVDMALDHFQQLGFITVGHALGEAALFKIVPSPERDKSAKIITRMIDSWGRDSVEPEAQALARTELTPEIAHYLPRETLAAGLYFISLQTDGDASSDMHPIALMAADR
jgi:hypothetical protein